MITPAGPRLGLPPGGGQAPAKEHKRNGTAWKASRGGLGREELLRVRTALALVCALVEEQGQAQPSREQLLNKARPCLQPGELSSTWP